MRDSIFLRELPKAIVLNLLLAIAGTITFFVGFESLVVLRIFGPVVFGGLLAAIFLLCMEGLRVWKQWKSGDLFSDDRLGIASLAVARFKAPALFPKIPSFRSPIYTIFPVLIGVSWIFSDETWFSVHLRTIGALALLIAAIGAGMIMAYRFFRKSSHGETEKE